MVVTGSFDSTVKIWDCKQRSEKPIVSLSEAKDAVSSIAVSGAEILAGKALKDQGLKGNVSFTSFGSFYTH